MQIVIDIPNKAYEKIVKNEYDYGDMNVIIQNGTPLPKGHGRLIDASNLLTVTDYDGENEKTYVLYDEIDNAPTIIEADKEEK